MTKEGANRACKTRYFRRINWSASGRSERAACILLRVRYARDRPNPPLSPVSIEPPSRPRKNTGRRIFWPALVRRHVEKTRRRAVTIFYRGSRASAPEEERALRFPAYHSRFFSGPRRNRRDLLAGLRRHVRANFARPWSRGVLVIMYGWLASEPAGLCRVPCIFLELPSRRVITRCSICKY